MLLSGSVEASVKYHPSRSTKVNVSGRYLAISVSPLGR